MNHPIRSLLQFLALLILPAVTPAGAATFVIGPPFKIQDAITAALGNADPFDTIFVQPGTYPELVTVDFTGAFQLGLNIFQNTNIRPRVTGGFLVQNARLVTISGFKIDSVHGDGKAQVRIRTSTAVAFIQCRGTADDDGGLDATDTNEVIVDNCLFSGMQGSGGMGIHITGRCDHVVRHCETSDNGSWGVWVEANRSTVRNCRSDRNGGGSSGGVYISGTRNEVRSTAAEDNFGIGVEAIGTCSIRSNLLTRNSSGGIRYGDGGVTTHHGGSIKNNTSNNNGGVGIFVRSDQVGAEVKSNTVKSNRGTGVKIAGDDGFLSRNKCSNTKPGAAGGHGILVTTDSSGNCIMDNVLKGNGGEGIRVNGDDNYLVSNRAKGDDGIIEGGGTTGNDGRSNITKNGANDFP